MPWTGSDQLPHFTFPVVHGHSAVEVLIRPILTVLHLTDLTEESLVKQGPAQDLLEFARNIIRERLARAELPDEEIFSRPWGPEGPATWRISWNTMWHRFDREIDE